MEIPLGKWAGVGASTGGRGPHTCKERSVTDEKLPLNPRVCYRAGLARWPGSRCRGEGRGDPQEAF